MERGGGSHRLGSDDTKPDAIFDLLTVDFKRFAASHARGRQHADKKLIMVIKQMQVGPDQLHIIFGEPLALI